MPYTNALSMAPAWTKLQWLRSELLNTRGCKERGRGTADRSELLRFTGLKKRPRIERTGERLGVDRKGARHG